MYQLKMLLDSDAYGIMLLYQLHDLLCIFHSSIHSFMPSLTCSLILTHSLTQSLDSKQRICKICELE